MINEAFFSTGFRRQSHSAEPSSVGIHSCAASHSSVRASVFKLRLTNSAVRHYPSIQQRGAEPLFVSGHFGSGKSIVKPTSKGRFSFFVGGGRSDRAAGQY